MTSSTRRCRRTRCPPTRSRTSCPRCPRWASTSSRMRKPTRKTRRGEADERAPTTDDGDDGAALRRREEEGNHRPHRRSGADVPARDGRGRAAQPRGRDRHRQAHRGRPRHDDPGALRKPDHLQRDHRLVERAQQRRDAAARDPRSRRDAVEGPDRPSRSRATRTSDGEISEKTAGPSYKEEEEVEEEEAEPTRTRRTAWSSAARRARPRRRTRTTPSASPQMEELLKPEALEKFADITDLVQEVLEAPERPASTRSAPARISPARQGKEVSEAARAAHRRGRERPVPRRQDRISGRPALQLQPPPDRARRPDAAPRRAPQGAAQGTSSKPIWATSSTRAGPSGSATSTRNGPPSRRRRATRSSASAPRSPRSPRRPA